MTIFAYESCLMARRSPSATAQGRRQRRLAEKKRRMPCILPARPACQGRFKLLPESVSLDRKTSASATPGASRRNQQLDSRLGGMTAREALSGFAALSLMASA